MATDEQRADWVKEANGADRRHMAEKAAKSKLCTEMFGPFAYATLTVGQQIVLDYEYERRERAALYDGYLA